MCRPDNCRKEKCPFLPGPTLSHTSPTGDQKKKNPKTKTITIEPENSPLFSKGISGSHKIQGIGANFVPEILNTKIYDEIITVKDDDAYNMVRLLGRKEGILVGISSGANLWASIQIAKRPENKGKNIVLVLPDTGDRYLSTTLFDD